MKKTLIYSSMAVILLAAFSFPADIKELEIGSAIPKADLKMKDVSGKDISLTDAMGQKGLLVVFSCNTCPFVKMYESRIVEAALQARISKVGFILVNSNEAQRSGEDSYEAMQKYSKTMKYDGYYVVDKNSELADAFGATRTPHCFIFSKEGKLVYRGAIDNNPKDIKAANEKYIRDAINAVADGTELKVNSTKSVGCTIKRTETK